jgi:hypothetical protein
LSFLPIPFVDKNVPEFPKIFRVRLTSITADGTSASELFGSYRDAQVFTYPSDGISGTFDIESSGIRVVESVASQQIFPVSGMVS